MQNNKIQTIAPEGYFAEYSPELIEEGIARGRRLQGRAMGDAFVALYHWLRNDRPARRVSVGQKDCLAS